MSSSGSDSGDEDYVPSDGDSQPPSEVESDGEEEEMCSKEGEGGEGRRRKRDTLEEEDRTGKKEVGGGDEKEKSESLWSDFLNQVSPMEDGLSEKTKDDKGKEIVTQVYEFAGEKVTVLKEIETKEVLSEGSKDGKSTKVEDKLVEPRRSVLSLSSKSQVIKNPNVRGGGSILSSALDKLGKKNKLSTLEKSKLDWESYKNKEGISEELSSHNKGKLGYLEKRDFLERTDLKQYEMEKKLRNSQRSKR